MEIIGRVDSKGRILIPKEIREELGIKNLVKLRVEEGRLVITPIVDPLEELTANVAKGTSNVAQEIRRLRRLAEEEAMRRLRERWS